jgi:hypothetical protein
MHKVVHSVRRDYIATALYGYLAAATMIQCFSTSARPVALASQPGWFIISCTSSIYVGCLACILGRWWKDDLDGGAIEQFGIAVTLLGWIFYLYAFARQLPDAGWPGVIFVGAFLVAFGAQWVGDYLWRRRLKTLVASGDV